MADETKRYIIEVDNSGAIRNLRETIDAEREMDQVTQSVSDRFGVFGSFVQGVFQGIGQAAFRTITGGIADLIGSFDDLAERGELVGSAFEGFEKLGGNASVIDEAAEKTLGLVTNFDLLQAANKALIAEVPNLNENFATIAETGAKLANTLGTDTKGAIDQLITAISTGRQQTLQMAGIFLDTKKEVEEFAKANGVAAESIDEVTKKHIIQQAAIREVAALNERLADVTPSVANAYTQVKNEIQNALDKIGIAINQNPVLAKTLSDIAKAIKEVDFTRLTNQLTNFIAKLGETIVAAAESGRAIKAAFSEQALANGIKVVTNYNDALGKLFERLSHRIDSASTQRDINIINTEIAKLGTIIETTDGATRKFAEDALEILQDRVYDARDAIEKVADAQERAADAGKKHADVLKNDVATGAADATKELQKLRDELLAENQKDFGSDFTRGERDIIEELLRQQGLSGGAGQSSDFLFKDLFPDSLGEDLAKQLSTQIVDGIAQAFQLVIQSLQSGNFDNIGAGLGGIGGSIGGAIIGATFGPAGSIIGSQIGGQVGSIIGDGIQSAFEHVFGGGKDPENNARKSVDRFFADVFSKDRLSVIVNDQLSFIEDLDFGGSGGFNDGKGFEFLQTLPAEVQTAFGSIGEAFAELLGVTEDIGGQIGAVFANNIGGDLNNLQLLIQATGVSADDLKGALVDAFLDGKLSATEAAVAIQQVNEVMTDGIPGATGAVDKAFDNLVASAGRGRAAVDAFKDIFFEAQEIGINTFDQLRDYLLKLGYSVEDVDKIFTTLADQGITDFSQVTSATVEQIISLLAELENTGFGFAEFTDSATSEIDQLKKQIEDIPREFKSRYTIEVAYTGEPLPADIPTVGGGAG